MHNMLCNKQLSTTVCTYSTDRDESQNCISKLSRRLQSCNDTQLLRFFFFYKKVIINEFGQRK
jgi:hypothetical protein